MIKSCKIEACSNGMLGLHLSRAPWDPYPWISGVQRDSNAQRANLRTGDTVLELNGQNILGKKISEIAEQIHAHWRSGATFLIMTVWRNCCTDDDTDDDNDKNQNIINQQSLQKFATCLQHIAQLLECPVCLEVTKPPGWQCCNGHVLCTNCRSRSEKCPVCRVPLGPRGRCLLSDKLFMLLADSFPCDGVKSSKKKDLESTAEFHNQPKMAIPITMITASTNHNNNISVIETTTTTTTPTPETTTETASTAAAKLMVAKVRAKRDEIKAKEIMRKVKSLNTPNNNDNKNNDINQEEGEKEQTSGLVARATMAECSRGRISDITTAVNLEDRTEEETVDGFHNNVIVSQTFDQPPASNVVQRASDISQAAHEDNQLLAAEGEANVVKYDENFKEHAKLLYFMRKSNDICKYNNNTSNNNNNNNNNKNLLKNFYNTNNNMKNTAAS